MAGHCIGTSRLEQVDRGLCCLSAVVTFLGALLIMTLRRISIGVQSRRPYRFRVGVQRKGRRGGNSPIA